MNKNVDQIIFILVLVTVLVVHSVLWFLPSFETGTRQLYIFGFRWHHFYTGALLIALSWLLPKQLALASRGIGLGLMIDEATLPLNLSGYHQFTYRYWGSIVPIFSILLIYGWIVFHKKTPGHV